MRFSSVSTVMLFAAMQIPTADASVGRTLVPSDRPTVTLSRVPRAASKVTNTVRFVPTNAIMSTRGLPGMAPPPDPKYVKIYKCFSDCQRERKLGCAYCFDPYNGPSKIESTDEIWPELEYGYCARECTQSNEDECLFCIKTRLEELAASHGLFKVPETVNNTGATAEMSDSTDPVAGADTEHAVNSLVERKRDPTIIEDMPLDDLLTEFMEALLCSWSHRFEGVNDKVDCFARYEDAYQDARSSQGEEDDDLGPDDIIVINGQKYKNHVPLIGDKFIDQMEMECVKRHPDQAEACRVW